MALLRRTATAISPEDRERAGLARRDTVLAVAELPRLQARLLVTRHHVVLLPDAGTPVVRAWHLVDTAGWARDDSVLRVAWVDGAEEWRLALEDPSPTTLQALRERVQASVVAHEDVRGPSGGAVRVVVRQDLASGELVVQTLWGAGADPDDPRLAAAVRATTSELRDAVGLPPA